jgi:hypothetical protein
MQGGSVLPEFREKKHALYPVISNKQEEKGD